MQRRVLLRRMQGFLAIILIIVLSFSITFSVIGYNKSFADTQSDLDKTNQELEKLKKDQSELDSQFSDLNNKLSSAGAKVAQIELEINSKQSEIDDCNKALAKTAEAINYQYEAMKIRIKYMYEAHDDNVLEILLSSKSLSDLLLKTKYIVSLSDYDHKKLFEMKELLDNQVLLKNQLTDDLKELNALKEQATLETDKLSSLVNDCSTKIDSNNDSIKKAEELALQYEEKIRIENEERMRREREALANSSNAEGITIDESEISDSRGTGDIPNDSYTVSLLAAIIECEAGNQSYEGKCAVGSVVINRVLDSRFPDTVAGVIYSPNQFSPVASGRLAIVLSRGATSDCVTAAQAVLGGYINISALYFHAYNPSRDFGGTVIGDHFFY